MNASDIVTLTVNPSLDKSTKFTGLLPEQKIRCDAPHYDAGGGGINVSKAISRLGGESTCIFTSGGSSGHLLEKLVQKEKIETKTIQLQNWTRENFIALETGTNSQYRFGFPGCPLNSDETIAILDVVHQTKSKFFIANGSLNDGLSSDFYSQVGEIVKATGAKFIADTSGEALKEVLKTGAYLIKPNVGELAKLVGVAQLHPDEADDAALTLINSGGAEIVVVSLGAQGAVLVTKDETHYVSAPNVRRKSTVGAGDSMVGGMVWALSQEMPLREVIRWGVACGSAATMNEGTQLFTKTDAHRLYNWLQKR
jgi:6-phosphofructokinase 2